MADFVHRKQPPPLRKLASEMISGLNPNFGPSILAMRHSAWCHSCAIKAGCLVGYCFIPYFLLFNLNWHELWNLEKCSYLAPPRDIFIRLNELQMLSNNLIDFNFHLQKSLENFDKNSADEIWSKNHKEIKVSPLMPIRVKIKFSGTFSIITLK